jgi:hypothetical protein
VKMLSDEMDYISRRLDSLKVPRGSLLSWCSGSTKATTSCEARLRFGATNFTTRRLTTHLTGLASRAFRPRRSPVSLLRWAPPARAFPLHSGENPWTLRKSK